MKRVEQFLDMYSLTKVEYYTEYPLAREIFHPIRTILFDHIRTILFDHVMEAFKQR